MCLVGQWFSLRLLPQDDLVTSHITVNMIRTPTIYTVHDNTGQS